MSIIQMYKLCANCGRTYTYNPSVGNFGIVCPHCRKKIGVRVPFPWIKL